MRANERVNQVCPGANIQDCRLLWNDAIIPFRKKIGKVMDVICAARHGWAEKAFGNIPVRHAIKMGQQRFVQRLDRLRSAKLTEGSPAGVCTIKSCN